MITLFLCSLLCQDSPRPPAARWASHQKTGDYYRMEDFELDHAVEEFIMTSTLGATTRGYTLNQLKKALPNHVVVDVRLLQEFNYQYRKIAEASLTSTRTEWRWLIWLRYSDHSQVRAVAEDVLRRKFLCVACNGTGRCVKFVKGEGRSSETCSTCGWGPYSHSEEWFTESMRCRWCDENGVFGKGRGE